MIKSNITLNLGANFDDITKALKVFNKSTGQSLSDTIKKGLEAPIADFKKELEHLKTKPKVEIEKDKIREMAKRIKDATHAKLELDLKRANEQIWDLRGQIIGIYASFKGLISKPLSASINFNNAINEVNRFSNFSTKELDVFKKDIWSLGKTNGVKLDDIIKTSEILAKLGVAKDELKSFSQVALDMQVGLGLGIEQSTQIGTKLTKAFNLSTKELRAFLDGTVQMSKTINVSGENILNVVSAIASGAKAFGLSAKETSALSASFLSVGLDSSEASASINKFFTELNNIDNASEGFKRSLNKMGIDAEGLKEDIQSNPQEAIKELFSSMNDLDDEERFGVISEIFGKKMANNINSAKDGMKAFDKALLSTKDSANALGKAVDRAAGDGFGDVVVQLGNAFKHLGVSIGNTFVPILKPIFESIKTIADKISDFLESNKKLGTFIATIGLAFIGLKTTLLGFMMLRSLTTIVFYPLQYGFMLLKSGVLMYNLTLIKNLLLTKIATVTTYAYRGAILALNKGLKTAGIGLGLFSKAFKFAMFSIKIAMISTGIGALIVGLGLAIAGAVWGIMKIWKPLKAFFGGFFKGLYEGLAPIREAFGALWASIKTAFAPLAPLFSKIFGQVNNTQEELSGFAQAGLMVGKVIGGVISLIAKPFEILIKAITIAFDLAGKLTGWLASVFGEDDKKIEMNATKNLKGTLDETLAKQNENKAKMLSSISSNQTDNSRQINDYKTITINTNANPQTIASAINSYSYEDDF